MRADYGLYIVAIICFIIAALPYTNELLRLDHPMSLTLTVIFAALGLVLIILGYSLRPKPIISILEAPKPAVPPSAVPPTEETTAATPSIPTPPTPPQEETAESEAKKPKAKTRRETTQRRRKKT